MTSGDRQDRQDRQIKTVGETIDLLKKRGPRDVVVSGTLEILSHLQWSVTALSGLWDVAPVLLSDWSKVEKDLTYIRLVLEQSLLDTSDLFDPAISLGNTLLNQVETASHLAATGQEYAAMKTRESEVRKAISMLENARQSLRISELANRAESAVQGAETAADTAREAAGVTATTSLSTFFATYAKSERRAAEVFRAATILAVLATVAMAILLPHEGELPSLIYRIALLGAAAGLTTYLGRQAGNHRRVFNWAKSVQVQLQSFPSFIASVNDDSVRSEIQKTFAARVLGAPPEKGQVPDTEVSSSALVELVVAALKRSETKG